MIMQKRLFSLSLVWMAGFLMILGCANSKPFKYHSGNEIPEGPGLLSREKGEFTIYDSNKKASAPAQQETTVNSPSVSAPSVPAPAAEDGEAFRQFQEWKQEQAEYEAFQEWKQSQKGAQEYQEFQEWKRWKEYQRWNDEQKKSNKIDY